ncbi:ester cyclase (plasmid) [Rhizobium sp. CB3060]|uniref:ester cyclase n=1 Tax=Rhizobium sp. CB3060 TaxID=3138255 RepID=UPI0021A4370D|nr:ester cyclase [Rhizobium tropici]UWU26189.1 ester cyclase [Rhizobium tropici]
MLNFNWKRMLGVTIALATLSVPAMADDASDLAAYRKAEAIAKEHLANFDTLDFDVFNEQQWDRIKESHSADVKVYWPDGRVTEGIETHINDMKYLFSFAPDTRISEHPVKMADGEWTSVIGVFEGTFTKPMKLADGKEIAPTGKAFKIKMATVGHWTEEGTMDEEYLFFDNKAYMDQIGLGQ